MILVYGRHGETFDKATGRVSKPDAELNPRGIRQGQRMGYLLRNDNFDALYTSPYPRAYRTAKYSQVYHPKLEILPWSQLRERDYGSLEGNILEGAEAVEFRNKRYTLEYTPPGGGEALAPFYDRVYDALDLLLGSHIDEKILVVSHAGTGRILDAILRGIPIDMVKDLKRPANCEIRRYNVKKIEYLGTSPMIRI